MPTDPLTPDEIQVRREAVAKELRAFEAELKQTVSSIRDKTENAVDSLKNAAETLSLPHQIRQHPLAAVGGAILAGFTLAYLGGKTTALQPEIQALRMAAMKAGLEFISRRYGFSAEKFDGEPSPL